MKIKSEERKKNPESKKKKEEKIQNRESCGNPQSRVMLRPLFNDSTQNSISDTVLVTRTEPRSSLVTLVSVGIKKSPFYNYI